MIKKCNDFGAGGVSVAIGELADGLIINLDLVPKKYAGLDGTELSISESQERMAVVLDPSDVDNFIAESEKENLEAVVVAEVTEEKRMVLNWEGNSIVDLSRDFIETNGATAETTIHVLEPKTDSYFAERQSEAAAEGKLEDKWMATMTDLNVCSRKGLEERFDSSIGAGSVLMPYGGKNQMTPTQSMVAKIPLTEGGDTSTGTIMAYGYNPYLTSWSPYHGAVYACVDSVAKTVAVGGDYSKIRFTFQEYFKRLGNDPSRWGGEPFSALLGAYRAQAELELPSIGGKDSMSGTFHDIDVPPTLVSFAVDVCNVEDVISPEFKEAGHDVVRIALARDEKDLPNFDALKDNYNKVHQLILDKKIVSAYAIGFGGVVEAVTKMTYGNMVGITVADGFADADLFTPDYGGLVLEMATGVDLDEVLSDLTYDVVGKTTEEATIVKGDMKLSVESMLESWEAPLEHVFPATAKAETKTVLDDVKSYSDIHICKNKVAKPKVFIPVFPGTNCEYDSTKAFENAGAEVETLVFRNLKPEYIEESLDHMARLIKESQIVMVPGGFSAGDEPEGSGKFIASIFRNEILTDAVHELLNNRDGLMIGICNGFQALIKLGLVPYGEIHELTNDAPTLTYNTIGRHISCMANTKVMSNKSPWLAGVTPGDTFAIPMSHGEGRFVASDEVVKNLFENGQVATTYVDLAGNPTMDGRHNPNGSVYAIEGITSPDGRILGKMGHSERIGSNVARNIIGNQDQKIFKSGVDYFIK